MQIYCPKLFESPSLVQMGRGVRRGERNEPRREVVYILHRTIIIRAYNILLYILYTRGYYIKIISTYNIIYYRGTCDLTVTAVYRNHGRPRPIPTTKTRKDIFKGTVRLALGIRKSTIRSRPRRVRGYT